MSERLRRQIEMENDTNQPEQNLENQTAVNQSSKLAAVKQSLQAIMQKIKEYPFVANMNPQIKKMIKVLLIGLAVFFILLVFIGIIFSFLKNRPRKVSPTPTPTLTNVEISLEEEVRNHSRYATDSAVLAIEEEVKKLDKDLMNVDLKESGLWPPDISFQVKFEE